MARLDGSDEDSIERVFHAVINLQNNTQTINNRKGNTLGWYGRRLFLLRMFYGKTQHDITYYLNVVVGIKLKLPASRVLRWEANDDEPNEIIIKHLADLFNVTPTFFTERVAHLNIVEQIKLTEI